MTQRLILALLLVAIALIAAFLQNIAAVIVPGYQQLVSIGFVVLVVHQFHDVFTRLAKDRFGLIG
jgi:hypothetical protein